MNLQMKSEIIKELVEAVSTARGFPELMVEKDYMVSVLLERLSKIESVQIVFKGGTSLSKCYKVINRFSEDIDIAIQMKPSNAKTSVRKKLKQEILQAIEDVGFQHINQEGVRSRRDFNRYLVKYPKQYNDLKSVSPDIIIETIVIYEPYPCEIREVSNYIIDYLEESEDKYILEEYGIKKFEMLVQRIDRTFIDKLYALCDYHLGNKYTRYSRHLYDVHMIYNSGYLDNAELKKLAVLVANDRQQVSEHNPSCSAGVKPNEILAEIVHEDSFKNDYETITSNLIHDGVVYDECIKTIQMIIEAGILPLVVNAYGKDGSA